jgi:hypothetical protein
VLGLVSVLAAFAVLWALWERRKGNRCARMHLAVSARLHEVSKRCAEERGRVDVLLLRLGRQVERGEGLREISEAAALAARLFEVPPAPSTAAGWPDSSSAPG